MDNFLVGWFIAAAIVLVFFVSLFTFLHADHRWDVGRDEYLMSHCKVLVQQFNSSNGDGTKEYNCKEQ